MFKLMGKKIIKIFIWTYAKLYQILWKSLMVYKGLTMLLPTRHPNSQVQFHLNKSFSINIQIDQHMKPNQSAH